MTLLGVSKIKFYISTPFSPKTEILGQFKKALTVGMLTVNYPSSSS